MLEEAARWMENLKFEEIPPEVVQKAKLQVLSVLAAGLAGARSKAGQIFARFPLKGGKCFLLPKKRTDLLTSVFINSSLSMVHDYDDYLFLGHTGHSSVFVSLAVCQEYGLSGKDFLKGVIIGNELEGRLGAAVVLGPLNGQTFAHIHQAGASAVYLTLTGGNSSAIESAIYLSLYLPPFCIMPGFMEGESKFLTAALPSASGILCGISASCGMKGYRGTVFGEKGFLRRFSFRPIPQVFTGWGKAWTTNTLSYKIYPGCAYVDSAIDCMMRIKDRFEKERGRVLLPSDVEEIKVYTTLLSFAMEKLSERERKEEVLSPVNINFSIILSLSLLIITGELSPEVLSEEVLAMRKREILETSERIKLFHDWNLTTNMVRRMTEKVDFISLAGIKINELPSIVRGIKREHGGVLPLKSLGFPFPLYRLIKIKRKKVNDLGDTGLNSFPMPFSARVIARLNGRTYEEYQEDPLGSSGRPLKETERLVREKFKREAESSGRESESLLRSILEIEKFKNLQELEI